MNEPEPSIHNSAEEHIASISRSVGMPEVDAGLAVARATGENDGVKNTVDVTRDESGTFVQAYNDKVDILGRVEDKTTPPMATLGQRKLSGGGKGTEASVDLPQGKYQAVEVDGKSAITTISRPGYREDLGPVKLSSPRARQLVESLANKAVRNSLVDIGNSPRKNVDRTSVY